MKHGKEPSRSSLNSSVQPFFCPKDARDHNHKELKVMFLEFVVPTSTIQDST